MRWLRLRASTPAWCAMRSGRSCRRGGLRRGSAAFGDSGCLRHDDDELLPEVLDGWWWCSSGARRKDEQRSNCQQGMSMAVFHEGTVGLYANSPCTGEGTWAVAWVGLLGLCGCLHDLLSFVFELSDGAFCCADVVMRSEVNRLVDGAGFRERVQVTTFHHGSR